MRGKRFFRSAYFLTVFISLILTSSTTQAGWFDDVKKIAQETLNELIQPEPTSAIDPSLRPTDAETHQLPNTWQSYLVEEPVFHNDVLVATAGKPGAPWVLLVHGLGQNGMRDWLKVVPALQDNYRVLLIDLPGFGGSPAPKAKLNPTRYSKVLNFIQQKFTSDPVYVVGHSMGGAVSLRYTQMFNNNVKKLMMVDAAGILERTAFVKHNALDRIPVDAKNPGLLAGMLTGFKDLGGDWVEKIIGLPDPSKLLSKSDIGWGTAFGKFPNVNAAMGLVEEDFTTAVHGLDKDVAILWGRKDKIAPTRTGITLSKTLPRVKIQWVDNAGHVPMNSHSHTFNQWLINALNEAPYTAPSAKYANKKSHNIQTSKGNFECKEQSKIYLRGNYDTITLNECTAVFFHDLTVKNLTIRDSVVESEDIHVTENFSIEDSTFVMTSGHFDRNIQVKDARIDLAGVTFSESVNIHIQEKSRLIFSTSRRGNSETLHGDFVLHNTTF